MNEIPTFIYICLCIMGAAGAIIATALTIWISVSIFQTVLETVLEIKEDMRHLKGEDADE